MLAATAIAAVAMRLLVPSVATQGPGFEGELVRGCALAAAACTAWGWLSAVAVVVEALCLGIRAGPRSTPGVPAAYRRLVLAACGVALSTAAAPALATPGADPVQSMPVTVAGLPFPARAMDLPAQTHHVVAVRPGDSLWAITAQRLAAGASDREISEGWQELYARNKAVIGDDPALIRPGQQLVLPHHLEEPS
ncbi:hypothetical protein GCM10009798_37090 [Nocardioides panacihumi]|uniref:LysM domain-containing protein n=1 Tax=Nocardioides panacihumi TaxID=400774 RepID=A0ABN2RP72_9ACTN